MTSTRQLEGAVSVPVMGPDEPCLDDTGTMLLQLVVGLHNCGPQTPHDCAPVLILYIMAWYGKVVHDGLASYGLRRRQSAS